MVEYGKNMMVVGVLHGKVDFRLQFSKEIEWSYGVQDEKKELRYFILYLQ